MILEIIEDHEKLRKISQSVKDIDDNIRNIIYDMHDTMLHAKGLGLAAVQVGFYYRMFIVNIERDMYLDNHDIIDKSKTDYLAYGGPFSIVNPFIIERSKELIVMNEGCLSVPGIQAYVSRPRFVIVEFFDQNGNKKTLKAQGWLARCILHEYDHLDGVLYIDYLSQLKRTLMLNKLSKFRKNQTLT